MARALVHPLAYLIIKKPRRSFQLRLRFLASTYAKIRQNHAPELISESLRLSASVKID